MAKKTETKKEAVKPKASTVKKVKRSQTKPKKENVVKQDVNVTEDAVEEVLSTNIGQEDVAREVVTDVVEQPTETIINVDDETEEKISSYENEEGDVEKADEEIPSVDDVPVNDAPEEIPEEVKEEQVPTNGPREISSVTEEFNTETVGDEFDSDNVAVKVHNEKEPPQKKKSKIIRYLQYLWNGVEID